MKKFPTNCDCEHKMNLPPSPKHCLTLIITVVAIADSMHELLLILSFISSLAPVNNSVELLEMEIAIHDRQRKWINNKIYQF